MNRKKSETSKRERELILEWHKEGKSYKNISELIKRSKSTVHYIIKKYNLEGNIANKPRSGRPKKLTQREEMAILREIKKDPFTSAPKLAAMVATNFKKDVHPELCRRLLRINDFHGRVPRRKPFISKKNKLLRLNFAKEYLNKDHSFWRSVIFSDESKYNIFGSDGHKKVWRKPNNELQVRNIRATVKHGGGSIMVWGCMALGGVGNLVIIDGILDKMKYLQILKNNLKDSATKLGLVGKYYFQQDNDPKHTAKIVKEWILYNTPHILKTPPQSPDLNPIEHLWDVIERQLRTTNITSKEVLKQKIVDVWQSIDANITANLVNSMENRLRAVIAARGGPTKY